MSSARRLIKLITIATLRSATVKRLPTKVSRLWRRLQNAQRLLQLLPGRVGERRIPLSLGQHHAMLEDFDQQVLDLGPTQKLHWVISASSSSDAAATGPPCFLREIEIDGEGFVENEPAVIQHRHLAVRIELQEVRRLVARPH